MGPRRPIGDCPICHTRTRLTEEDVYPRWLRRSMADHHLAQGNLPAKVIVHLCAVCNAALGRTFEDTAAPILKRMLWERPLVQLSVEETWLVARWAVKTDVMFAVAHQRPAKGIVDAAVRDLRVMITDPRHMPAGSMVRVLHVDPAAPPSRTLLVPNLSVRGGITSFHPIATIATDTFIGCNVDDVERYVQALKGDERSSVFYPLGEQWPPRHGIALEDVERYRAQIGQTNAPKLGGGWNIGMVEL